ncbi:NAD(P)H-binding protein [Sphingomonas sp. GC_Shp_1]|uniref:NAD-dependent epimerase/dehydratase family protein n=1 Tax=unclassified Sphingomonas TaxID=196159 RepID=UPI00226A70D8
MILAITGGTGFVGRCLIDRALGAGHKVRALTRRAQPPRDGVTWIEGALGSTDALATLASGAAAMIHVAGVVNAPTRDGFVAGNIDGTAAVIAATLTAGVTRFVHVSSLSAREPALSTYGWSKAEAERLVEASPLDWTIVRPSGVYGPGDTELRDVFKAATLGVALLPPHGTVSLIEVDDLATLLLALATRQGPRAVYEVDDGTAWTHAALAQAIGRAVGRRRVLAIHLPRALMMIGAWIDRRLRGAGAKLTADRVGYLTHPDWTARADHRPPADLWAPATATEAGLAATAAWYRANGLL